MDGAVYEARSVGHDCKMIMKSAAGVNIIGKMLWNKLGCWSRRNDIFRKGIQHNDTFIIG
jgi:hypothetical protein